MAQDLSAATQRRADQPAARWRTHASDLRRAGNQRRPVRTPLRLEHPQWRLLLQQEHPRHVEPLLGGPRNQHCRAGDEVRPACFDERRGGRRDGRPLAAGRAAPVALPKYFSTPSEVDFPDLFAGAKRVTPTVTAAEVATLHQRSRHQGLLDVSRGRDRQPIHRRRPDHALPGTAYQSKHVGDFFDTSPYPADNPPDDGLYVPKPRPEFIVSQEWIRRMSRLIAYISPIT